ncbi:MAG: D-sedoheptulose 7-phosphate isomerase [Flavobacteriales bacterium]|jgi:D-sedoheptulose 7-phosphate isomerase|nr:D-sedoheptulose 7-phosphate isomerase [Flavobacteriales bacterium]
MNKQDLIKKNIKDSLKIKKELLKNETLIKQIVEIADLIIKAFKTEKKLLFCGNGGSAADAQHLAAEFSGRYYLNRAPLHAEALHTDTSFMTAVANDFSFDEVYSRLIKGIGKDGDILIGMSTSGNSKNVTKALEQAKKQGLITIGFTGKKGGEMNNHCDLIINIPSNDTPRIQECHLMLGHAICELVEKELFS